jgi:hypothetical protein
VRRVLSLGIRRRGIRLAVWLTACAASSAGAIVWWPLGVIPFAAIVASTILGMRFGRWP